MKKILILLSLVLLGAGISFGSEAKLPQTDRLPGADLAEGVTQLTGVAISPLLGVSAVGAWKYYKTPGPVRTSLPWFCQPYAWGTGFFLISLCFLKDLLGTAAPALIKKPLDFVELFENKCSALIACSAFLPFIVAQMAEHGNPPAAFMSAADPHLAAIFPMANIHAGLVFGIPFAIVGFLLVWLSCHAINVLIALCPFGIIDATLKLFKGGLLGLVVVASFISPYLGAAVCCVIIVIAIMVAPWAFRLTVFGTLFGLDVLLPGRGRLKVTTREPHSFLARSIGDVPVRTYGRLSRAENGFVRFTYRPWLLYPSKSVVVPEGRIAIAKGILFPSLLHGAHDSKGESKLIMFLPRYRANESGIADHFEIQDIRDSPAMRGIRAMKAWFRETVRWAKSGLGNGSSSTDSLE